MLAVYELLEKEWGEGAYCMVSKMYFGQKFVNFFYKFECVCVSVLIKIKYFKTDQNFIKKKIPKNIENFFRKTFYNEKNKALFNNQKKKGKT